MATTLSPQVVISIASVVFLAISTAGGSLWAISQTQLGAAEKLAALQAQHAKELSEVRVTTVTFELTRLAGELNRRESEVKDSINNIRAQLLERDSKFVSQFQFAQFEKSMDDRWRTQAETNRQAIDAYVTAKAWEAWKAERDKLITEMLQRLRLHEELAHKSTVTK